MYDPDEGYCVLFMNQIIFPVPPLITLGVGIKCKLMMVEPSQMSAPIAPFADCGALPFLKTCVKK